MAPLDVPSPTPSSQASTLKRPRQSAGTPAGGSAGPSRAKRRKPEDIADMDEAVSGGRGRGTVNFGVGMVKGREDEWGEPADIVTKVDFNDLPTETLYKYLEYHDLLPHWDVSPWSEEPCTPPNALYSIPLPPPTVPIVTEGVDKPPSPGRRNATVIPGGDVTMAEGSVTPAGTREGSTNGAAATTNGTETDVKVEGEEGADGADGDQAQGLEDDFPMQRTTRSKTAPSRKPPTPLESPVPEHKRGVITLSDVYAAKAILAEKANAHWVKGLGGGQNKEGETIVQFLYKMKAGPGRLLRVYNPFPPPYQY